MKFISQGIDALVQIPGPVDAVRFLQIYDPGAGDYTKDRKQWLESDPEKYIADVIAHMQKVKKPDAYNKKCYNAASSSYTSFTPLRQFLQTCAYRLRSSP